MSAEVAMVTIAGAWGERVDDLEDLTAAAVAAARAEIDEPSAAPVVIAFADDAVVRDLNREHRGKDAPTNVLAFPAAPGPEAQLGDVVLAFETVAREADERRLAFAHHAAHLIVHGYLHLEGYDHNTDAEAADMEAVERRALARIGVADPYQTCTDA